MLCLTNMSVEQYVRATTGFTAWKKLEAVHDEMGHIIDKIKDDNISVKFDTSLLEGHIKQVGELHFKVEKLFTDRTPEELEKEKQKDGSATAEAKQTGDDDVTKYQMTQAQMERQ